MDLTLILRRMLAERRAYVWDVATGTIQPLKLEESVALTAALMLVEEQEQRRAAAPMRNLMNGY